ncbi:hypothetical protein KQI52_08975 [bacterium]|nr:hypothetical protein [bacterium]
MYGPGYVNSWILRGDAQGNEIWTLLESGGENDATDYIEPTRDGGFITCGETWNVLTWDGFVRKLNADGEQLWARRIGDINWDDVALCVRELPDGSGFVATGISGGHPFLWKLAPDGQTVWRRNYPYIPWEVPNFVEPAANGDLIVAAAYPQQFFLARFSASGQHLWHRTYQSGDSYSGEASCVREAPDGSIYAAGTLYFFGTSFAWYVIKTDPQGNLIWEHIYDLPTTASQEATELCLTPDGNLVVAGFADPNYLLMKYDPDGNVLWQLELPDGKAFSIDQMRDGGYIFGGEYTTNGGGDSEAFHLIKTEPEVLIELQPWNPQLPASGGWLSYGAQVSNILVNPTPLDAWLVLTNPDGQRFRLNSFPVTLQPGATFSRPRINVWIPPNAPNGTWTLEAHLGVAPPIPPPGGQHATRNMGLGSFAFTKSSE